jgi:hypothetical protein
VEGDGKGFAPDPFRVGSGFRREVKDDFEGDWRGADEEGSDS